VAERTRRVPYVEPFDWTGIAAYLNARVFAGVETIDAGCFRRAVGEGAWVEIANEPEGSALRVTLHGAAADLDDAASRAASLFDCAARPAVFGRHLAKHGRLARLFTAHPGVRVPGAWDAFELSVRAVLGQQVSVKGATTLAARLVARFGEPLASPAPGLLHSFPAPEALARADLTVIGLPKQRAHCLNALAEAATAGALRAVKGESLDSAVARLAAIDGIGPWTAHYVAMRALRQPDAFPASDLGLRRAYGGARGPVTAFELERAAERWRPWRAYAAMLLWCAPS
jgi:AraC family transcriptional regulator of adaptative response / DNA-3-methyladenine glycosylase II